MGFKIVSDMGQDHFLSDNDMRQSRFLNSTRGLGTPPPLLDPHSGKILLLSDLKLVKYKLINCNGAMTNLFVIHRKSAIMSVNDLS